MLKQIETYFETGSIKSSFTELNGKKHGLCKRYADDCTLESTQMYNNGVRHGEFKMYCDQTGEVIEHSFMFNGKLHGEYVIYTDPGVLEAHCLNFHGKYMPLTDFVKDLNNVTEQEKSHIQDIFGDCLITFK